MSWDTDSDYDSESDGYDSAEEIERTNRRRDRSRSRLDESEQFNNREREPETNRPSTSNNQEGNGRRRSSHRGRRNRARHGRRHRRRQRNRRSRIDQEVDESWYFPDEGREETAPIIGTDLETHDEIISGNNNWLNNLATEAENERANEAIANISPLTRNDVTHTIRWNDNQGQVTLTPTERHQHEQRQQGRLHVQPILPVQATNSRETSIRPIIGLPRPPPRDLVHRVPLSSVPDVNANLQQLLRERNQALQRLTQETSNSDTQGTAASVSYGHLTSNGSSEPVGREASDRWDGAHSWDTWSHQSQEFNSLLNMTTSQSHTSPANRRRSHNASRQNTRNNRNLTNNLITAGLSNGQVTNTANDNDRDATMVGPALSRHLHPSPVSRRDSLGSQTTRSIRQVTSNSSAENDALIQVLMSNDTGGQSQVDPFSRYDGAYRRQAERNMWRERRRHRNTRQQRRERDERRQRRHSDRQRAQSSSSESLSHDDNEADQEVAQATEETTPPLHTFPYTPPSPPVWSLSQGTANMSRRLSYSAAEDDVDGGYFTPDYSRDDLSQQQDEQDYDEYTREIETILRRYEDPAESNTALGVFLRGISERGRVIVSRVRTRITKQYFRRGNFQIALADFRNLQPQNARQVAGVGYTGTINNMYRVTVKQNSSFGKPTFEIRPMNKKVRKKKVHICYKIRYIGSRKKASRASRIPTPV